eukprot:6466318-Amphidinium_carterae.1
MELLLVEGAQNEHDQLFMSLAYRNHMQISVELALLSCSSCLHQVQRASAAVATVVCPAFHSNSHSNGDPTQAFHGPAKDASRGDAHFSHLTTAPKTTAPKVKFKNYFYRVDSKAQFDVPVLNPKLDACTNLCWDCAAPELRIACRNAVSSLALLVDCTMTLILVTVQTTVAFKSVT